MKAERISPASTTTLDSKAKMKGRSPQLKNSTLVVLRRSLVVAGLMLALLAALIPFSAASSAHFCTMECCIGKAPHAAGECSSGLLKGQRQVAHDEPEALCGLHVVIGVQQDVANLISTAAAPDTRHPGSCASHQSESADDPAAASSSKAPGVVSITSSMTTPCSTDCGACSGAYVRQPRPREQAMIAPGARGRPPSSSHFAISHSNPGAALNGHYQQPPSRGPPTSLS